MRAPLLPGVPQRTRCARRTCEWSASSGIPNTLDMTTIPACKQLWPPGPSAPAALCHTCRTAAPGRQRPEHCTCATLQHASNPAVCGPPSHPLRVAKRAEPERQVGGAQDTGCTHLLSMQATLLFAGHARTRCASANVQNGSARSAVPRTLAVRTSSACKQICHSRATLAPAARRQTCRMGAPTRARRGCQMWRCASPAPARASRTPPRPRPPASPARLRRTRA